jgi:pimeloyl-ACP methyl ester carboxylesterase
MPAMAQSIRPPSKLLLLMEGRAIPELAAFVGALPLLRLVTPPGDGHPVLVLPGLLASDASTRALRGFLKNHGYGAHGWRQGRNLGPRDGVEELLLDRIKELSDRYGRKVSLVGWSLGGLYARQAAKRASESVRLVITLGSPFTGNPRATNAWQVYEYASGRRADEAHVAGPLSDPPPVPTTAIFSRTDGICAWQCCVERDGPQTESIEVDGSHCGLGHHPAAVYAIADRLAQPEGAWKPFDRGGWRSLIYPDHRRAH